MKHWSIKIDIFLVAAFGLLANACEPSGRDWPGASAPAAPSTAIKETPSATAAPMPVTMELSYLMGKFDPSTRTDFVAVKKTYTDKPDMYLRREAYEAFEKMALSAKKEGVVLKIISSTRTFAQQKAIWEGKWERFAADQPDPEDRARKILEYSSMPGTSRHHWGTDLDLNDLNNPTFEKGGKYEKVYQWLSSHAHEYGFCQPYTPKGAERPHGYNEEKWHWSYQPLSKEILAAYKQQVTDAQIVGFKGAETASTIHAVGHYVSGVSGQCQ